LTTLSIIIVSFNARDDLLRCLDSILGAPPTASHELIVIDNASRDGSADAARQKPGVRVIDNAANVGFARANNIGIHASSGAALLLLNSDTLVAPGAIDRLLAELDADPTVAVVGPRLRNDRGEPELSYGRMIGPFSELRQKRLARGPVEALTRTRQYPDWVSGACLLVRRADAEAVGGGSCSRRKLRWYTCAAGRWPRRRGRRTTRIDRARSPSTRNITGCGLRFCACICGCAGGAVSGAGLVRLAGLVGKTKSSHPTHLPYPTHPTGMIQIVRIGIDARKLHDFGIGTYIRNLVRHLARLDQRAEYVVLCRAEDRDGIEALGENFRAVVESSPTYSVAEQVTIPLALRREGVTLFHAPHYVLPPLVRCRSVVTIHDCIHLMFPQYLPNRMALTYARTSIRLAAHRATRVMTVSESSKRDILRFVDLQPEKIDVIYNAYDERFGVEPCEEDVVRVRERYQLHDEFVLYAGNVKPHKNLERLIDAFHLVRKRGLEHLKLVMIGDEISRYSSLRRAVHRHQLHKYVRFLGYLPEATLAVMYRLAGVFVFPSLYEGFGLPPLEAMASGTPVVTSNVSSLPEVAGDAAVLIDPYDPASIAGGIEQVLTNETLRHDLRQKGLARARQFSWEQSVRRVREIYEEVSA